MSDDVDWGSYWAGLLGGLALLLLLIRWEQLVEQQAARRRRLRPVDPFDRARWDVLDEARRIIDGECVDDGAAS